MPFGYFMVKFGSFSDLEIVVDPKTHELWVSFSTLAKLLGWEVNDVRKKIASKSLEQALDKDQNTGKSKLIKAKDTRGTTRDCKAIPFDFALKVIYWQVKEGNEKALQLVMAGFAESFTSLALEQAGIQVSVAERQDILEYYLRGYHQFFDWIRDHHLKVTGQEAQRHHYIRANQIIDAVICNRENFDSDRAKNATKDELRDIENFQRYFMKQRAPLYPNTKPLDAIKDTLLKQYTNASELLGN